MYIATAAAPFISKNNRRLEK